MRALVVRPGDTALRLVEIPADASQRGEWFHRQVEGLPDWNGMRHLSTGDVRVSLVVHDTGHFEGLARNELATQLYYGGRALLGRPPIVGAVVVMASNMEGDTVDLPAALLARLAEFGYTITQEA